MRTALHVDHSREWVACDDVVWDGYDEDSSNAGTEPYYQKLVWGYEFGGAASWVADDVSLVRKNSSSESLAWLGLGEGGGGAAAAALRS